MSPSTVTTTSSDADVFHDWSSSIMRIVSSSGNDRHGIHTTQTTSKSSSNGDRNDIVRPVNAVGELDNNVNTEIVNMTDVAEQQPEELLMETDSKIKTGSKKTIPDKSVSSPTNPNELVDTDDDISGMPDLQTSDPNDSEDGGWFKNVTSKISAKNTKRKFVRSSRKKVYSGEEDKIIKLIDTNDDDILYPLSSGYPIIKSGDTMKL